MTRIQTESGPGRGRGGAGVLLACSLAGALLLVYAGCKDDKPTYNPYGVLTPLSMHWPQFRGPDGSGTHADLSVPVTWDDSTGPPMTNVLWKEPVPLQGAGSPIVCGDRVFLSGADVDTREVYCFDANTGELLWRQAVATSGSSVQEFSYDDRTYAASTVASDGVCVFAMFGNGDLVCFDYDGRLVWILSFGNPLNYYGHASSLVIYEGLLIVQLDQDGEWNSGTSKYDSVSRLFALEVATGRTVWEASAEDRPVVMPSWSTPTIVQTSGGDQLVTFTEPWAFAHDPATGTEIWRAEEFGFMGEPIASPMGLGDSVVIGTRDAIFALGTDGAGDVTGLKVDWTCMGGTTYRYSTPVTDGILVFSANVDGYLMCIDATDGTKLWEYDLERPSPSLEYGPSPVLLVEPADDDRLYFLRSDGVMIVAKAKAALPYEEWGRGYLGSGERFDASPAFVGGRIYIRGDAYLYCIEAP